jgi:hypothetical protein
MMLLHLPYMDLLRVINKKYLGQSGYDPTAASLGKWFYNDYLSLSAVCNDIRPSTTSSAWSPLQHNLLHSSFGKLSTSHSFVQDACRAYPQIGILRTHRNLGPP